MFQFKTDLHWTLKWFRNKPNRLIDSWNILNRNPKFYKHNLYSFL